MLAATALRRAILPAPSVWVLVRLYHGGAECIPVFRAQSRHLGHDLEPIQGGTAQARGHGLDLKKRHFRVECDGNVGSREADIGEQRAEPAVGGDDTLIGLISGMAHEVRGSPNEKIPTRRLVGVSELAALNFRSKPKPLTVTVKPNTTVMIAAHFNEQRANEFTTGGYWDPVMWKEVQETCP